MSRVPLTEAQEGLWLARRLDPDNPIQNTGRTIRIRGPFSLDAFRGSVARVLEEADALSVRVEETPDGPGLVPTPPATLEVVDLSEAADAVAEARFRIREDMARPRDPTRDRMVTGTLYRLGPKDHLWYQCIQHLVVDGYGTMLLDTRILDVYRAAVREAEPATRPLASFSGVVEEDRAYRTSERREEDRVFWMEEMKELAEVGGLAPGEPLTDRFHHRARGTLPSEAETTIRELADRAGSPWPDALVTLTSVFLDRHLPDVETVVGVPAMNRLGSAAARVPCMAMNILPVRVELEEDADPVEAVRTLTAHLRRGRRHGRYRSEQLRRDLGLLGEGRRLFGPLVNVLPFRALPGIPDAELEVEVLGAGPVDDLTLTFRGGEGEEVVLEVDANPGLYPPGEVEEIRDRLLAFLERFADGPRSLARVSTLTDAEHRQWIHEVNDTGREVEDVTLPELFDRAFSTQGGHLALDGHGGSLTYDELERRTRRLASRLAEGDVGPGSLVAVRMPASVEQVVTFVAILRAGAAYLPLDPEHPRERVRQILELAGPERILEPGSDELAGLEVSPSEAGSGADRTDLTAPTPQDPAYVIFTSGSTGTPKGVVVEHRAIVNRLQWMRAAYDVVAADRVLQKTPATFDVSVWELFLPLVVGATLVVAPPEARRDPGRIAELVRSQEISMLHFVPSMLGPFLDDPASEDLEIPRVICSGEELLATLRDRFHRRVCGELHNLYGPTEAAVDVTAWPAGPDDDSDPVPIGRPVWNTGCYVLDAERRPVPPGVVGELYLAGVQLARGYLGREDLTAERFVPDPFDAEGGRMYRTGDRARWRRDGVLVFCGRVDHQVKLRGQRVELGEVTVVLRSIDGVGDAAVVLREDLPGGELAAYVTPQAPDSEPSTAAVQAELARRLPEVMVPADIVILETLPLTSSGKLDRSALPRPSRRPEGLGRPPENPTERTVARVFQDLLGLDGTPRLDDDFFALGGHSLLAISLVSRIREELGVTLGPGTLFGHPTVGRLAVRLEEASGPGASADGGLEPWFPVTSSDTAADRSPLYCVHPAGGIAWCYGALARALDPPRPVVGLQARGLDLEAPLPDTLEEMADDYVQQILERHPGGPIHLAGWSVGGIVAHAMAGRLLELERPVGVVGLLDAYPSDRWKDEPEVEEGHALRALLLIAGVDPDEVDPRERTREGVRARLREREHPLSALSDEALDGVVRVVGANNRLVRGHRTTRVEVPVLHFRAGLDHQEEELDASLWEPWTAGVDAYVLPTLHAHMTGPASSRRIAAVFGRRTAEREAAAVAPKSETTAVQEAHR